MKYSISRIIILQLLIFQYFTSSYVLSSRIYFRYFTGLICSISAHLSKFQSIWLKKFLFYHFIFAFALFQVEFEWTQTETLSRPISEQPMASFISSITCLFPPDIISQLFLAENRLLIHDSLYYNFFCINVNFILNVNHFIWLFNFVVIVFNWCIVCYFYPKNLFIY